MPSCVAYCRQITAVLHAWWNYTLKHTIKHEHTHTHPFQSYKTATRTQPAMYKQKLYVYIVTFNVQGADITYCQSAAQSTSQSTVSVWCWITWKVFMFAIAMEETQQPWEGSVLYIIVDAILNIIYHEKHIYVYV